MDDAIFKALNDPARRALLDSLRARDGQSLTDLEGQLAMSRFGVMKHLKVLEDAGLVIPRKEGRFKFHYLNALPLQEVIDRWIEPLLARPMARHMIDLKSRLETTNMSKPDFVLQTFIRCSQDALWAALTDPEEMAKHHFLTDRIEMDGDTCLWRMPDDRVLMRRRTLEIEPKSRIVETFEPQGDGAGKPSKTITRIDPLDANQCSLTLEHYGLTFPVEPGKGIHDGWSRWAASLKTWLETGKRERFGAVPTDG